MKPLIKYAFAALLLAVSTFSYSNVYVWRAGSSGDEPTKEAACQFYANQSNIWWANYEGTQGDNLSGYCLLRRISNGVVQQGSTYLRYSVANCPAGTVDDGNNNCLPPNTCLSLENVDVNIVIKIPPDISTNTTWQTPAVVSSDGCLINTGIDSSGVNHKYDVDSCKVYPDSTPPFIGCTIAGVYTGGQNDGSVDELYQKASIPFTPETDTLISTQTQTVGTPVVTSLPNNDVLTEQTTVDNTIINSGTKVESTSDNTVITESTGTSQTDIIKTDTLVKPDGSITETIDKNTNVTTPNVKTTVVNHIDNSVTSSGSVSNTYNSHNTVVNNYSSDGSLTGSTQTTSGEQNPPLPPDENKKGNCGAPGQPVCDVRLSDTSSDYSSEYSKISSAQAELQTLNDGVVTELSNTSEDYGASSIPEFSSSSFISSYLQFPVGSCSGGINTTIFGKPFVLEPCVKLAPLREILAWVFFILTTFQIVKIVIGRKIL